MEKYVINEDLLSRIERLQSLLKNNIAGMFGGNHKSRTFGSSSEFADYREYVAGDDITKIDWNVYARSESLYLKQFLDERQLHTRIYIDTSRSMDFGEGDKSKMAVQIAATIAYLSVSELDRVSIYTINESEVKEVVANLVGKERYYNEIAKLNDIKFGGDCFISEALMPAKIGYGDGLSVIISDFLTDNNYERAIDYLVDKKKDLLCIQVLSGEELNPQFRGKNHFFDSENPAKFYRKNINMDIIEAYRRAVKHVQDRISDYCNSRGANYVLVPTNKNIEELFFEQLTRVGVLK